MHRRLLISPLSLLAIAAIAAITLLLHRYLDTRSSVADLDDRVADLA